MKLSFPLLSFFVISFSLSISAQNSSKVDLKPIKTPIQNQSPRITTSTRPIVNSNSTPSKSVNGETVVGEGKYLTFTKQIMEASVTGQIPEGFPKHVKGQTKEQYVQIMKVWAKNNLNQIKEKYRAEAAQ